MPDVTVEVPVKVKGVSVKDSFDPKYKTSVPKDIKPQIEKALAKIKLQIPKGKQLGALAVDVNVSVKRTDKGLTLEVRLVPSEDNKMLGGASGEGSIALEKDEKVEDGDVTAAAKAAADEGVKSVIKVFSEKAKKP